MFSVGDYVVVNNGVSVNGTPLSEIAAKVERVTKDYLFLIYDNFKYVASINACRKVKEIVNEEKESWNRNYSML